MQESGASIGRSRSVLAAIARPLLFLFFLGLPPAALATAPGANGLIAYTDLVEPGTPTGRQAVFLFPGGQLSQPTTRIAVVGNTTTSYNDYDSDPAWSPDGRQVAFVRRGWRDTTVDTTVVTTVEYAIYVVDLETRVERRVADEYDAADNPTYLRTRVPANLVWSPDGDRIGFLAISSGAGQAIASVRADGGDFPKFTTHVSSFSSASLGGVSNFDWSRAGFVYPCSTNWTGPRVLFCTQRSLYNVETINAIGEQHGPLSQGILAGNGTTRWKPSGRNGKRVMISVGYSTDLALPNAPFRTNVFSLATSAYDTGGGYIAPGLVQHTWNEDVVSCTYVINGVPVTNYAPRVTVTDPIPSPDGRYFVARSIERRAVTKNGVCYLQGDNDGLFVFREDGSVQSTVAVGPYVADPAWQPDPAKLVVRVTDGDGNPLEDLKVELRDYETKAPVGLPAKIKPGGTYAFDTVSPGQYRIRAYLTDHAGSSFEIRHGWPSLVPVEVDQALTIPPNEQQVESVFAISNGSHILSSNVESGDWERLDDMANIYFQTRRFVDWARRNLGPVPGAPPLPIHTFATAYPYGPFDPARALYDESKQAIYMGTYKSDYMQRDDSGDASPENGEWHEYAHYLHDRFALPGLPRACPDFLTRESHGGWNNDWTCDSLIEGLATFLAALAGGDPDYGGIAQLEDHIKAWDTRLVPSDETTLATATGSAEDLAVAALLWDLVDGDGDSSPEFATYLGSVNRPVVYRDDVQIPVSELWQRLAFYQPKTVAELRNAVSMSITIDLDGDGVVDVSPVDSLFLMHGFHPVISILQGVPEHDVYKYDYEAARSLGQVPNARVGLSSHYLPAKPPATGVVAHNPRFDLPASPTSNLAVSARDASGTPLRGASVELSIDRAGSRTRVDRTLPTGDGDLVHLELPPYFEGFLPADAPLPPCDPAVSTAVRVTARAALNGYASLDERSFDGCDYWQAVRSSTDPASLDLAFAFPEDANPPVTTADRRSLGQITGDTTTGSWTVEFSCTDPVAGGFASGCVETEHSLDGGPFVRFREPVDVIQAGEHQLRYRSRDAAGNDEAIRAIKLVVPGPDMTAPFTLVTLGSNGALSIFEDNKVMGSWTVALGCTDEEFKPVAEVASGCARTEYRVDGAAFAPFTTPVVVSAVGSHTFDYRSVDVAGNTEDIQSIPLGVVAPSDLDQDGLLDFEDNCHLAANPDQRDTDRDRYGNRCDPDFNQNGTVDSNDASVLKARLGASASTARAQDLDGNGVVDAADMNILKAMFRLPPGPSRGYDYFGLPADDED